MDIARLDYYLGYEVWFSDLEDAFAIRRSRDRVTGYARLPSTAAISSTIPVAIQQLTRLSYLEADDGVDFFQHLHDGGRTESSHWHRRLALSSDVVVPGLVRQEHNGTVRNFLMLGALIALMALPLLTGWRP